MNTPNIGYGQHPRLSWDQYGTLLDDLWKNLKQKLDEGNINITAIIAILREGSFTAMPLAYKLNTYKVMTIQYKYLLHEGSNELVKVSDLSVPDYEIPENPTFLLCDTFPCGGQTKFLAAADIKKRYPNAKFVFASLIQDLTVDNHPDFLCSAYAFDIDEDWHTTHPLFKSLGIDQNALDVVLPWENAEEEEAAVNSNKWEYN
jgi:hypothetical protein